jgi:hypothetical protein
VPKQDEQGDMVRDVDGNESNEVLLEVRKIHKAILEWNQHHFHRQTILHLQKGQRTLFCTILLVTLE